MALPIPAFLRAATIPRDQHASGTLDEANALVERYPELPRASVHAAAVLGDADAIHRFIADARSNAVGTDETFGWDPLTFVCFSRYLRLDASRSDALVRTARALLDAGASANTGWFESGHQPNPTFESAIYGAAGIAQHVELTRLLLERGADPNDDETPYHVPETYDNRVMHLLVESRRLTADSLAMMLVRKADWHDLEGMEYLLEHGADPNRPTRWGGRTAFHHAILRDNRIEIVNVLLAHGADPSVTSPFGDAVQLAARRGRSDVLHALADRDVARPPVGLDGLLAACALDDTEAVKRLANEEPASVRELAARGGEYLATFAGGGNVNGVRHLLDLGVPVTAAVSRGDGYWGLADRSTALHVAAWRARHDVVQLLIARGAQVNAVDANGRTPLMLAVRACVDSYWKERRAPDSVRALLAAGASTNGVSYPSGYPDVDRLLQEIRR